MKSSTSRKSCWSNAIIRHGSCPRCLYWTISNWDWSPSIDRRADPKTPRQYVPHREAARWHAQPRSVQGRKRESLQMRLVAFLATGSRGGAAITIVYRLYGER